MIINLYGMRDAVTGVDDIVLSAQNDDELVRMIKHAIVHKTPVFLTNSKDKQIFYAGTKDTSTGEIKGVGVPVMLMPLQQIIDDLEHEIALAQARQKLIQETAEQIAKEERNG